jgi:hypothetical protein
LPSLLRRLPYNGCQKSFGIRWLIQVAFAKESDRTAQSIPGIILADAPHNRRVRLYRTAIRSSNPICRMMSATTKRKCADMPLLRYLAASSGSVWTRWHICIIIPLSL